MTTTAIPTTVAYFEVSVPLTEGTYGQKAADIVARYLYGGRRGTKGPFNVVGYRVEDPYHHTVVTVAFTGYETDNAKFLVDYQRDRLRSGLYPSSEPVWFDRRGASA